MLEQRYVGACRYQCRRGRRRNVDMGDEREVAVVSNVAVEVSVRVQKGVGDNVSVGVGKVQVEAKAEK